MTSAVSLNNNLKNFSSLQVKFVKIRVGFQSKVIYCAALYLNKRQFINICSKVQFALAIKTFSKLRLIFFLQIACQRPSQFGLMAWANTPVTSAAKSLNIQVSFNGFCCLLTFFLLLNYFIN
jgi:hypothetical protein